MSDVECGMGPFSFAYPVGHLSRTAHQREPEGGTQGWWLLTWEGSFTSGSVVGEQRKVHENVGR